MPKIIASELGPNVRLEVNTWSLDYMYIGITNSKTNECLGAIQMDRPAVIELLEYFQTQGLKL